MSKTTDSTNTNTLSALALRDADRRFSPATTKCLIFSGKPEDWSVWSMKFKSTLFEMGLLSLIQGNVDEGSEKYLGLNTCLYYLLPKVIGDANIPLIHGSANEGDGLGAWKVLEPEYLHRNSSLRQRLKSDLKLVKFSDYLDKPSSYFIRVNETVNHLKQIQVAIEDDDLVLTLRDQLPPSEYQTVIYDINKQGSSMTFEETKRLVIATHDVLSAHKGSSGSKYDANEVEQAMIAWRGRNNNSPSRKVEENKRPLQTIGHLVRAAATVDTEDTIAMQAMYIAPIIVLTLMLLRPAWWSLPLIKRRVLFPPLRQITTRRAILLW